MCGTRTATAFCSKVRSMGATKLKAVIACACAFVCGAVQVSGEAQYTDDVALPPNTLHAAFVTSTKPHAKLLGVDASAALAMLGRC